MKIHVPMVSVVMSVYNNGPYLPEALDSILEQTYGDFEFVIIDDGSKDNSSDILKEYAGRDPRIRILIQSNQGLPSALNAGLALARGRYIARMDADDISLPDRLEKQVRYLEKHPDIAVLGTQAIHVDEKGDQLRTEVRLPCDPLKLACRMISLWPMYHPSAMFRKDVIMALGGYRDIDGFEDRDLWLRVSGKAQLANLNDVLLKYRVHGKNKTLSRGFSVPVESYANCSLELFDIPANISRRIYERRMFFCVFPWIARSAGRIAERFNVSSLKVLFCREFLDAWLILAWKQDPVSAGVVAVLKIFSS